MIWANTAKKYLAAFAAKDEETLSEMYSDGVQLSDWSCRLEGKDDVLAANRALFDKVDSISVRISNTCYRDKYICVEFTLILSPGLVIGTVEMPLVEQVVDIIEFDSFGKIKSIRAYKQ